MEEQGLIAAYLLDGQGGAKKIGWKEILHWTPDEGVIWVHLDFTKPASREWLEKQSQLDPTIVSAMIAEESRPRAVFLSDGIFTALRGLNTNPAQEPEDMVSIRVWIDNTRIITTRRRMMLSVSDLREALEHGHGPTSPTEFLVMLNDRLSNRMADAIEDIDDLVDELETSCLTAKTSELRPQISEMRREAIAIRRYLSPQREALYRLTMEPHVLLKPTDQSRLRESTDRLTRYIEDLDEAKDRATVIQEELSSRVSEQMNSRMYVLSIVTVIFLPLMFLTGLLGINVGGIPGAQYKWGFLIVCALMIAIFLANLYFLKRKKWM